MNVKSVVVYVAIAGMFVATMVKEATAATVGDQTPKMTNGAVAVATASATPIPATCTPGVNSFSIFNNGPNTIWCGRTSGVTNTTGFPVCAGCSLNVDIVCGAAAAKFYCRADTAIQVSPADTRYLEVK